MLDEAVVREALAAALTSGGDFSDIFVEERRSLSLSIDDGRLEHPSSGIEKGAGIRVCRGDSTAYAYTNDLDESSLLEAARGAASGLASFGPSQMSALARRESPVSHPVSIAPGDVPTARKVNALWEADESARSAGAEVRQVAVSYQESEQRLLMANSEGFLGEESRTRVRFAANVVATRDGVVQTGFEGPGITGGFELFDQHPPSQVGATAARRALTMLDSIAAPAGVMPVVLAAGAGGVLIHEACGHGLEADIIAKEASVYRGRIGERIGASGVNVVDDPTLAGEYGSYAFDDEGTPAERTVLLEDGVLASYLIDKLRSAKVGAPSNAHGRRNSYQHLPICRMANTHVLPGADNPEDIIRSVKRGFLAANLAGGEVNPATGNFVFGVAEGYLIEDGQVTKPVRGANLIGNGPEILALLEAIGTDFESRPGTCGKDGQWVPVTTGMPTALVARMTVGGTQT